MKRIENKAEGKDKQEASECKIDLPHLLLPFHKRKEIASKQDRLAQDTYSAKSKKDEPCCSMEEKKRRQEQQNKEEEQEPKAKHESQKNWGEQRKEDQEQEQASRLKPELVTEWLNKQRNTRGRKSKIFQSLKQKAGQERKQSETSQNGK